MAKHMVKCAICGISFDTNTILAVHHGTTRYSHATCEPYNTDYVEMEEQKSPELRSLTDFIVELNNGNSKNLDWAVLMKRITALKEKDGYTYGGIHGTLYYLFKIKKLRFNRDNILLGLVPYYYREASQYFKDIAARQCINGNDISSYKIEDIIIQIDSIDPPILKPIKLFLDEE